MNSANFDNDKKNDFSMIVIDIIILLLFFSFAFFWKHTSNVLIFNVISTLLVIPFLGPYSFRGDSRIIIVGVVMLVLRWIAFGHDKTMIVNIFIPCMAMLNIKLLFIYGRKKEIDIEKRIMYSMVCASIFECMLSVVAFMQYEDYSRYVRFWPSYFFYLKTSACGYEFFTLLMVGIFFYSFLILKKNKIQSIFFISITLASVLFFFFIVPEKAIFFIFIMVVVFDLFIYCMNKEQNAKAVFFACIMGGIIIGLIAVYSIYLWREGKTNQIIDFFSGEMWTRDGGILNNERFVAQRTVLSNILKQPYGKESIEIGEIGTSHNFWVDIAFEAGLIPFILICIYTIMTWQDIFKMFRRKHDSFCYFLFSSYLALFLWMSVESIVKSSIMYCTVWLMISECIYMYGRDEERKIERNYKKE